MEDQELVILALLDAQDARMTSLENQVRTIRDALIELTAAKLKAAIDTTAASGGQKAMLCPDCGGDMVSRTNRDKGNKFWGCKRFPVCRGTRDEDGLSKAERDELKYKKEDLSQDGFSFNREKRHPATEVSPPVEPTRDTTTWINPFAKK